MKNEFTEKIEFVEKTIKENEDKQKERNLQLKSSFDSQNNDLKNELIHVYDEIKTLKQKIDKNNNEHNQKLRNLMKSYQIRKSQMKTDLIQFLNNKKMKLIT